MMRFALCLAPALLAGCLPEDTRPEPGRLNVTVSGDAMLDPASSGSTSVDGWQIRYDRFLLSLGEVELEGDECTEYNESDYLRLFDMRRGTVQRVSTPYGRGGCEFTFRLQIPDDQVVLGDGVTEADEIFMRTAGSDAYVQNAGMVMFVSGTAVGVTGTKRFSWAFRHGLQYDECGRDGEPGVHLESGDDEDVNILIVGGTLFQDRPDEAAGDIRFEPFVRADEELGNGDGEITLEELDLVPLDPSLQTEQLQSHADLVYLGLVPRVPRFRDTGTCSIGPIEEGGHGP